MKYLLWFPLLPVFSVFAATGLARSSVTIYNRDISIVHDLFEIRLETGINEAAYRNLPAFLDPSSVVFLVPDEASDFKVVEQSYQSDVISEQLLLEFYRGTTIDLNRSLTDIAQSPGVRLSEAAMSRPTSVSVPLGSIAGEVRKQVSARTPPTR